MNQRRLLTKPYRVDRADRAQSRDRRFIRHIAAFGGTALLVMVALYFPVHRWLHAHLELFAGILIGSLLQSIGWIRDRWRWMKWFSR